MNQEMVARLAADRKDQFGGALFCRVARGLLRQSSEQIRTRPPEAGKAFAVALEIGAGDRPRREPGSDHFARKPRLDERLVGVQMFACARALLHHSTVFLLGAFPGVRLL